MTSQQSESSRIPPERTHDKFYLEEDWRETPKEYFIFIGDHIERRIGSFDEPKILDIGSANGDFLFYLKNRFPSAKYSGFEVRADLVEASRKRAPGIEFIKGDIESGQGLPSERFDIITMNGVHAIFDSCEIWLKNIIKQLLASKGVCFVFGAFNPDDVDVQVRVRHSGQEGPWELGWNSISQATIISNLERLGVSNYNFKDFKLGIDLPRQGDPLRSWTVACKDGSRMIVNGAAQIRHQALLEFSI